MTLPHFEEIPKYDDCEVVFKNLYEFNITTKNDNISPDIISYLNENVRSYNFKENIDNSVLEVITNTNIIDGKLTILDNISKEFHITISMFNKEGIVIHKIEDDFVLFEYEFDQNWINTINLLSIRYTFIKDYK